MASADSQSSTRQRGSIMRNALLMFGSQTVTWTLSAAVLLILPRLFGVDAVGRFAIASSIWSVAGTVIGFGSSTFVTLESARRPDEVRAIALGTVRLRVLTVTLAWMLVAVLLLAVGYSSEIVALVGLVGLISTVDAFIDVGNAALIGLENMAAVARADVVSRLCATAIVLAVALSTRNLLATVGVGLIGSFVRASQIIPAVARQPGRRDGARWSDARNVARGSSPFFVAGIALVVYHQVDTIVMSILLDEREIGWYGAALLVFSTLLFAPNIVMTSLLPALTREHARDEGAAIALLARAFDSLVLIAVPIGLAATICAPGGIKLLFGDKFAPASQVLSVMGFVLLFSFLTILLGSYAYATGRQRFWNVLIIASIVLSVPLDFLFVPWMDHAHHNGAIGGALAYLVTELLMVIAGIAYLVPQILTSARVSRILRCGVAGAAMVLAGWPVRDQFVVIPCITVLAVYATVVLLIRVPNEDEYRQARSLLVTISRGRLGAKPDASDLGGENDSETLTDWALLTRLLSLREAERTMTPEGWGASVEVGRQVNASDELSRALSTHLGSWVGELARGAAHNEDELAPYRTLAATEANWNRVESADARDDRDRRTLLALLVVDAVRLEQRIDEIAQQFGRRMVDAGVLTSWEQVTELDEAELARCLTEPSAIRERLTDASTE